MQKIEVCTCIVQIKQTIRIFRQNYRRMDERTCERTISSRNKLKIMFEDFSKIDLDTVSFTVWPRQPRNETLGSSRSTGCQSLSSVRCLAADKKPKNENHENCENINKIRFLAARIAGTRKYF